jgi:hypothetical protein
MRSGLQELYQRERERKRKRKNTSISFFSTM